MSWKLSLQDAPHRMRGSTTSHVPHWPRRLARLLKRLLRKGDCRCYGMAQSLVTGHVELLLRGERPARLPRWLKHLGFVEVSDGEATDAAGSAGGRDERGGGSGEPGA